METRTANKPAIACQESNVAWRTEKAASLRGAAKREHDISFLTVNKAETANELGAIELISL
jgi:hypothetical protein